MEDVVVVMVVLAFMIVDVQIVRLAFAIVLVGLLILWLELIELIVNVELFNGGIYR